MGDHPIAAPTLKKGVSKGHPFSMVYFFVKWLLLRKNPSSLQKHPTEGNPFETPSIF